MNTKIYTYKEVYTSVVKLYADGGCRRQDTFQFHTRDVINKMACVNVDNDLDLISELYNETSDTSIAPASSLYVVSECKTGRDTFRNSGYSITRSKDKADAIVVPDVRNNAFYTMSCNVIAKCDADDDLYLFNVDKPGYLVSQLTDTDLQNIRSYLKTAGFTAADIQRSNIRVWFMPKCEELMNVMTNAKMPNVPYVQESMVPIKASTQFSPETLVFWENISDGNLLARTICTSDWMNYPMTLKAFLAFFKKDINWYNFANNDFRRILKSIGYEYYYNPDYIFNKDAYITPEDYEMLQSYLYYKLGLDEKGGMVNAKLFDDKIPPILRKFLRRMTATKPVTIPKRMKLRNLQEIVNS